MIHETLHFLYDIRTWFILNARISVGKTGLDRVEQWLQSLGWVPILVRAFGSWHLTYFNGWTNQNGLNLLMSSFRPMGSENLTILWRSTKCLAGTVRHSSVKVDQVFTFGEQESWFSRTICTLMADSPKLGLFEYVVMREQQVNLH